MTRDEDGALSPSVEEEETFYVPLSPRSARLHARRVSSNSSSAPPSRAPLSPLEVPEEEDEEEDDWDDWDDDTLAEMGPDDDRSTIIKDPGQATPLERRWLSVMSDGKDPLLVARFDQCVSHQVI
jgi:nitrogen permease regulator 3-like protein